MTFQGPMLFTIETKDVKIEFQFADAKMKITENKQKIVAKKKILDDTSDDFDGGSPSGSPPKSRFKFNDSDDESESSEEFVTQSMKTKLSLKKVNNATSKKVLGTNQKKELMTKNKTLESKSMPPPLPKKPATKRGGSKIAFYDDDDVEVDNNFSQAHQLR